MKNYKIITIFFLLITLFTACEKDLLDKHPLDTVSSGDFFKSKNDHKIYLNKFYESDILHEYPGIWTSNRRSIFTSESEKTDNQIANGYIDPILDGRRTIPASGGGYSYDLVRSVNYYFENYKKCEDPFDDYKQYLGEAYFYRAVIYYHLVQKFGDIVWLDYVPDVDSEILYSERQPRNKVIDYILADLDSAALYLSEERLEGGTRIDKWYALAYQSRVALYEGTWEKYHINNPFSVENADPEKYLEKAVQAADAVIKSGKFQVYSTGNPEIDYYNFFNLSDYSDNNSVLMWKKYSVDLGIINRRMYNGQFPGGEGLTKRLVDSYLCIDGKPISVSPLFEGHDTIVDEFKNRDLRAVQTVWTPEVPWLIDGSDTAYWVDVWEKLNTGESNYVAITGYCMRKGYSANVETHNNNGEDSPDVLFRYAEVLLNYAEAKAELGTITQSDIDKTIKLLRDRVGMPNLNLADIAVDPNWLFPDLSPVINELRRERRVELVSEGIRWFDIQRWAAADELIAGHRPKGIKAGQLAGNTFPVDENGFLDPLYNALEADGYNFDVNRDYLSPIPFNELTLNPNLKQNPGW